MTSFPLTRRRVLQGAGLAMLPLGAWAAEPGLTFLAVGDWGREGQYHQQDVADRMGDTATKIGARFIVSVGDNFYEDGVGGVDDPAWKASFEDVYTAPSLQVPWYVVLGNHDYHGDSQAQLDYAKKSRRWRMPARWFSRKERTPDGATAELFFLDTSPLIESYYEDGGAKVKVVGQDTAAQMAWFEKALSTSAAEWKIVVGHHPVYSGGRPGKAPADAKAESSPGGSPDLIARLDPLLQRHNVRLYLNGHDHDLQHVRKGVTDFVCTGAGSKTRNHCDMDGSDFCSVQSGFIECAIDRRRIRVAYHDYTGTELHVVDIARG